MINIISPRLLLVEGKDEILFFGALITELGLQDIQVLQMAGKTKLRETLKALVRTPKFTEVVSLGVVRDADSDYDAAFQSVCDALESVSLAVPQRPLEQFGNAPRVTVMILPKENKPGMLEDLCLESVASTPAMVCVKQYFECLQTRSVPVPNNLSKAKVHVFLASKPEADKRLGEAAQAGYWPLARDGVFADVSSLLETF